MGTGFYSCHVGFVGIDNEEFYETQMVWKTQIKKRFESLRLQGPSSYLHKHNQQNEELSQQKVEELRLAAVSLSVPPRSSDQLYNLAE